MNRSAAPLAWCAGLGLLFGLIPLGLLVSQTGPQEDNQPPIPVDLEESVDVRIIQMEVTAWPKNGDAGQCRDIQADDFEVLIKGEPREVIAADRLGDYGLPLEEAALSSMEDPAVTSYPMQYIVVFDIAHLDL